ncbi:MAG: hypothetical protein OXB95_13370 [Rhodobacteraceae bacterium]|nr:hypothetical protein [Paracoccaceae bacterium]
MAYSDKGAERTLLVAGCKRKGNKQEPDRLARQFEAFLTALDETGKRKWADGMRRMPRRLLLVSPEFTPEKRAECDRKGVECFSIRDMARELGIDPGPPRPSRN